MWKVFVSNVSKQRQKQGTVPSVCLIVYEVAQLGRIALSAILIWALDQATPSLLKVTLKHQ